VANFIPSEHTDKPILRYDLLFEEGLNYVQKYSGKIWTDYNYHDPGVTFLEYLTYALTDLGYRTNFPIEDLFLFGKDEFDSVRENLLFGPASAFSCSPITVNDYRKLIIDRIKLVANAWVIPIQDHKMGLKGLFEIFIECSEDLSDIELHYLKKEVADLFHANRLIGHDLEDVFILKKVYLSLEGAISIESDALGELVMAKMYGALDAYINPQVQFHDPVNLWKEQGFSPESVFTGPLPKFGFVFDADLTEKIDAIYLSRIKEIILSVEGVKEIRSLQLFKNGLPVFDNFVRFEKTEFPKINYLDEFTDTFQSKVSLLKNNVTYAVDPIITKQLLSTEVSSSTKFYFQELQYEDKLPLGRFSLEQVKKHYPIHNELPQFFGVGKSGVSTNAPREIQASALQVSAYLYFFEQIMASYLAQLSGLRVLFSPKNSAESYFSQLPDEIPNLDILISSRAELEKCMKESSGLSEDYLDRRNRLLDHLLARFGERFDDESLKKIGRSNSLESSENLALSILQTKVNLLTEIIELGQSKAKGFDMKADEIWDCTNLSSIEKRIALSLGITNFRRRTISAPLMEHFQVEGAKKQVGDWSLTNLPLAQEVGPVYLLPEENYKEGGLHFYGKGLAFLKEIFELGVNEKGLSLAHSKDNKRHYLLMKQRKLENQVVVYAGSSESDCQAAKDQVLAKIADLDKQSEGFHLIENLLLRPLESVSYLFSFLDADGEEFIEGLFPSDMETQRSLGEDLFGFGLQVENYSIVEDEKTLTYTVLVYNFGHEPVAKLKNTFSSKPGAKKAIDQAIRFFQEFRAKSLAPETVMEVNLVGGAGQGFPVDFQFSNTLSFVFPEWPVRFQKTDFVNYLKNLISENIMAHQSATIFFINPQEMFRFESLYSEWLFLKNQDQLDFKKIDVLSLQLIQLLRSFPSVYSSSSNG
jgi:hypothetical protein